MIESSNPMLKMEKFREAVSSQESSSKMTFRGISDKALILLAIVILAGGWTWRVYSVKGVQSLTLYLLFGIIACIGLAIYTFRKPELSPKTGPFFALFEGFILGSVSAVFEVEFSGIVIQAVASYCAVMLIFLVIHRFSKMRVISNFNTIIIFSLLGVLIAYFCTGLFSLLGLNVTYLHETGVIGIVITLIIIGIATGNMIQDFAFLRIGTLENISAEQEWYAAFSLMLTLVWLYLEAIKSIVKLRQK